ncbi:MAG: hypothetical protein WBD09_09495 [Halobacteriota archaeon]
MKNLEQLCDEFEEVILNSFFGSGESESAINEQYFYTPLFHQKFDPIKHVIGVSNLFNIKAFDINKSILKERVYIFENEALPLYRFKNGVNDIKRVFSNAKDEIERLCLLLDETEMNRINEAIHNFLEGCYYSSVAMSVCAIESRLLKLMSNVKLEELERLEKMTLGRLIREYNDNKGQYNNLIPKKHEPLLDLCNIYRIFSVHPKKEEITKGVASAILNLSIVFLTDEETQVAQEITEV